MLSTPSSDLSLSLLDRWIAIVGVLVVVVTGWLYLVIAKPHLRSDAPEGDAVSFANAMRAKSARSVSNLESREKALRVSVADQHRQLASKS
ncbi:hypothetical protein D3C81_2051670 [compost metagenome]